jgi:hypothetical protein
MRITIRKNRHYPFPYFFTTLPKWVGKHKSTKMEKKYMFTESCLYDLHNDDQLDINKLFGFSIGWHHNTSFRFGWRPDIKTNEIEIFGYEYHDGIRQKPFLIQKIKINIWYEFKLSYSSQLQMSGYQISIKPNTVINNFFNLKKKYGLGYTLGAYFGGNQKAPQNIHINKIIM